MTSAVPLPTTPTAIVRGRSRQNRPELGHASSPVSPANVQPENEPCKHLRQQKQPHTAGDNVPVVERGILARNRAVGGAVENCELALLVGVFLNLSVDLRGARCTGDERKRTDSRAREERERRPG